MPSKSGWLKVVPRFREALQTRSVHDSVRAGFLSLRAPRFFAAIVALVTMLALVGVLLTPLALGSGGGRHSASSPRRLGGSTHSAQSAKHQALLTRALARLHGAKGQRFRSLEGSAASGQRRTSRSARAALERASRSQGAVGSSAPSSKPRLAQAVSPLLSGLPPSGSYGAVTWGWSGFGELGIGTTAGPELCGGSSCSRVPVAVANLTDPVAIGTGENSVCAVISGGSVECWGWNYEGMLGDGTETGPEECPYLALEEPCSRTPVRVSGITNATAAVVGDRFACALLETHSIDCWGGGLDGELGDGSTEGSLTPVSVSGITNAIAIAAGEVDSCAVLSNHTVKCWGDGREGALGNESTVSSATPVEVKGITNAVAVTVADDDACAVLETGEVKCWGSNNDDNLGDGKTHKEQEYSDVPVTVSGITTASGVAASFEHVCAVLTSGKVECWGDNEFGDLGDGHSFEETATPVAVTGISTATQITAGVFFSCAVIAEGDVDCWGDNETGELGNGSTVDESSTPVPVSGLTGISGIAAGEEMVAYGSSLPVGEVLKEPTPEELFALKNPAEPEYQRSCHGDPVNCATGNLAESQTDLAVGGRGIPLAVVRTYNAQAAAAGTKGQFGYGWTGSFSDHLVINSEAKTVTVVQANGSSVVFKSTGEPGELTAPKSAQAKLVLNGTGTYTYTLPNQEVFSFSKEGHLVSETDRNGNATTLTYNESGQLTTITDPAGRKIKLAYNGEGLVESAEDPMKHVVKYTYESGNLKSVTQLGESSLRWQFKYNGEHEMTEIVDGRGGKAVNEYNGLHQVIKQEDPAGHKLKYEYKLRQTKITNEATGSVTNEFFTSSEEPEVIIRGYGTASALTKSFIYNKAGAVTGAVLNGHLTKYTYDGEGNRITETNADGNETKWEYNSTHDVISTTTPKGETTTIKRDIHGNPEVIERPAPGSTTQKTTYKYDEHGDLTSITNPLEETTKYEYDSYGDKTAEIDPLGNKWTLEYNENSQEIATTSPRGNVSGANATEFTTTTERDAQGRPVKVSESQSNTGKPVSRVRSSISGETLEGQTLTAATGIWEGAPTLTYTYRWERCSATGGSCSTISGETKSTYVLGSADVGYTIRVAVTATNSSGSASSTSTITGVISVVVMPRYSSQFGSKGTGAGQLALPYGVVLDSHGNVWVADRENNRVDEFTGAGAFVETIGWGVGNGEAKYEVCTTGCRAGISGSGEGEFAGPTAVAFGSGGNMYVTDFANDRVEEFNEKTEFVRAFGEKGAGAGQLVAPIIVTVGFGGNVWVADAENNRVDEFTSAGVFVEAMGWGVSNGESKYEICTSGCRAGLEGTGEGQFELPIGIAFYGGTMYVVDYGNNRVEEFNEKSEYVAKFGSVGTGPGQFEEPAQIAAETSTGRVYVGDWFDNRVEEFTSAGAYIGQFGASGNGNGQFHGPQGIVIASTGSMHVADELNGRIEEWKPVSTPVNLAAPSVSGEIIEGQTLTAGIGIWSASPAATYSYQWQRCNSAGSSCSNVTGATGAMYTLGGGDTGYRLRVKVKATNTSGSSEVASPAAERTAGPHTTEYVYDGDGNVESVTDPNGHKTTYTYNPDNERTKVKESNGTVTETEYDGAGQVIAQIDGNKHKTEYKRNALEQVTEVVDPLGRKTIKEYDAAGNLKKVEDPAKRTITYTYDSANRLTEVSYSSGKPSAITYEYDKDGDRTKMTDGTGTTVYTYDQLDRLTEVENGHKEKISYEYDLGNEQTKITYPNGKSVTRAFDKDGRLEAVTDWNGKETKFSYSADSELEKTVFPSETKDEDAYSYNNADQMSEVKMSKGTEVLASLSYARDNNSQVQRTISKGLPGEETLGYAYDENNRLVTGATKAYEYDAANNPTKIGTGTYKYNNGDELETGPSVTYTYNELGQRTKTTPEKGPATSYGYDQAGNLTSVERPKEGEIVKIEDTYTYNGNGLRASQTISGTTSYLAWDESQQLPLILSDGTNSYIYGLGGLPIEQINNTTGNTSYLHHDQQGSTRLITGEKGEITGTYTYDAYGNQTGHTGTATTPLGYDAQYTSSDTGLIYLRAREYDPTTAQFLSIDPAVEATGAPYGYTSDNPLNASDPTGRCGFGSPGEALESVNPFSEENCAYQGVKAFVGLFEGNAETISLVSGVLAAGLAVTPLAPVAPAFAAVSAAAGAYAAGENAANGHALQAALDSLGAVLGGESVAYRVLASIADAGAKSALFLSDLNAELRAASSARGVVEVLDKFGYGVLAASIGNTLDAQGAEGITIVENIRPEPRRTTEEFPGEGEEGC